MPNELDRIGPYQLVHKLGKGGFGEVWLARDVDNLVATAPAVALKLPIDDDVDLDAIRQEATVWVAASGHPNVLPMLEARVYDGQVVIASEYAPDGSLQQWLKTNGGKAPTIEAALDMTRGILEGLAHLHARKIIHRDLKPDNILLTGNIPRIADFGISRVIKTASQSMVSAGTPAYMAPEAFERKRNVQTDLWSVGVILYQLLSGRLPFAGRDLVELMVAIRSNATEPLPSNVPSWLQQVVATALNKNPAFRYQSANEMRNALVEPMTSSLPTTLRYDTPAPTELVTTTEPTAKAMTRLSTEVDLEFGKRSGRRFRFLFKLAITLGGIGIIAIPLLFHFQTMNSPSSNAISSPMSQAGLYKLSQGEWTHFSSDNLGKGPEASGVAFVPGARGLLVAADNHQNEILWMPINELGEQAGKLKSVRLNVSFADAEAITYGGGYFYVVTSQSDTVGASNKALLRFSFNAQTQTIKGTQAEIVNDLRAFLLRNVPEIAARGAALSQNGGLNIEGLAYDPNNERLLLGLRSPFIGSQALLVPLKLSNPLAPLALNNLKVDTPSVITLALEGQGVRDITFDPHLKVFLIISGDPETQIKTGFGLWEWSGNTNDPPRKILRLDEKHYPEGITSVSINGRNFLMVVGDSGDYQRLDYQQ